MGYHSKKKHFLLCCVLPVFAWFCLVLLGFAWFCLVLLGFAVVGRSVGRSVGWVVFCVCGRSVGRSVRWSVFVWLGGRSVGRSVGPSLFVVFGRSVGRLGRFLCVLIDPLGAQGPPLRCFIVVVPFHSSCHRLASLVIV